MSEIKIKVGEPFGGAKWKSTLKIPLASCKGHPAVSVVFSQGLTLQVFSRSPDRQSASVSHLAVVRLGIPKT